MAVIEKSIENERLIHTTTEQGNENEEDRPVSLNLDVPYAGTKGEQVMKNLNRYVTKKENKNKEHSSDTFFIGFIYQLYGGNFFQHPSKEVSL